MGKGGVTKESHGGQIHMNDNIIIKPIICHTKWKKLITTFDTFQHYKGGIH